MIYRPSHWHFRLHLSALRISRLILCLAPCLLICPPQGNAALIEIFPPTTVACGEQFENIANALKPGDELVLHGGTYSQSCYRAITVNGTASNPIIIRAATGEKPVITRPAASSQQLNNIDITHSSYLTIRGLHFRGGHAGVNIRGGRHITIEDCEIFETLSNGFRANTENVDALTLRRTHIHHTGLNTTRATEGEGVYLGCHDNSCRVTNSLIEGNYIHHLRATSGGGNDGIEVKAGSAGNSIRDNVIHDTTIGKRFPCIFVYGGGTAVNIVEGNSVWNCGEGIYAVSDAVVRNNIIMNSDHGLSSFPHSAVAAGKNLTVVNNTVYGGPECVRIRWDTVSNGVFANNAAYCPGKTAVNATGLSRTGLTIRANYVEGGLVGVTINNNAFFSGGVASAAFTNPSQFNFWPPATSILLGKANASVVASKDFNGTIRTSLFDIGAYERETASPNPGWQIMAGFKTNETSATILPAAPTSLLLR